MRFELSSYDQVIVDLIDRYAAKLHAFAAQWTNTPEDIVQEVFYRLVAQRKLPNNPGAWLFQVARNRLRQEYRARQRRLHREQLTARFESDDGTGESMAQNREVTKMLNELQPKLYEVVILRHWSHLSFQEIAEVCGASLATVNRRYHQAINQLKHRMQTDVSSS